MIVYHGTDYENAKRICSEGFTYKAKPNHWLGNGVYFFQDYSLAKWWTTNPTKEFGSRISKPAIIQCNLEVDDSQMLNLLKLEDYIQFSDIFDKEFYTKYYEPRHPYEPPKWERLRCAYCDYLRETYELDMIIGNFDKPDQPYLPSKHGNEFDEFLLQYTEVQICVFNEEIIKDLSIERL